MDLETNPQSIKPVQSVDQSVHDARDLAAMGHDQALTRKFDLWSMLSLAFCVLGMSCLYRVVDDMLLLTEKRYLFDFRAGSQQRLDQWRRDNHPDRKSVV